MKPGPMRDPSLAFADPLLRKAVPQSDRSCRKVLALIYLLMVLGCGVLWHQSGGGQLGLGPQWASAWQPLRLMRAWQFMQSARARYSMQPLGTLVTAKKQGSSMYPSINAQGGHLAMPPRANLQPFSAPGGFASSWTSYWPQFLSVATRSRHMQVASAAPRDDNSALLEEVRAMRLKDITAELKKRGISMANAFEKEELVKRLYEARLNNIWVGTSIVTSPPTSPPTITTTTTTTVKKGEWGTTGDGFWQDVVKAYKDLG
eukprot:gnl/TRDRNA2_/TRDRNA2_27895_c0_seq1.p1 gnl/TRDRNA2_/TRDRNA2_27895_c0~~gnl/TRDRNA2_/TRDRNA2_27895_c0_seq1.p1  ORF type:complete len:260 (-),score=29.17 gnl/TRDRNA2_/TRDRNA2_27895_c0_seq1:190-969(-)